jgi:hypothetical protein
MDNTIDRLTLKTDEIKAILIYENDLILKLKTVVGDFFLNHTCKDSYIKNYESITLTETYWLTIDVSSGCSITTKDIRGE